MSPAGRRFGIHADSPVAACAARRKERDFESCQLVLWYGQGKKDYPWARTARYIIKYASGAWCTCAGMASPTGAMRDHFHLFEKRGIELCERSIQLLRSLQF